ncbi:MAG: ABC transporter permease [Gammaproteobacteria bacterium]|jgi:putative ABC transport system permease protein|nr:ABC transporter permease [Gammaproteobacteria bacterium]
MLTLKLAYRNILRQRRRSLLTALSMAGGYMLFVFSMSLLEGSWSNVVDIFTLDHTGHIQVHKDDYAKRPKIHKTIENPAVVETTLKNHEDVTGWAPRVYSSALAYGGNKTSIARIFGIDPELEPTVTRILQKVSAGQYFSAQPNADGYFPAMIGRGLANSLRLDVGDEIVLISSGADGSIANDIFIITAIIGNTTSFDRLGVFLPLTVAQEFLSIGGEVHEFALLARNKHDNEQLAVELQSLMPSLNVSPWQQIEATFYRTMQSDKQGNYFTMALIVFIVFIGVLNTVLMSVLERTKEFGVLKSIGCRPSELVKLIFIETVMLASISISVGLALILPVIVWFTEVGIKLDISVDMGGVVFDTMKGDLSAYVVFMPMGFMLLTAALISLPPGLRAARILPRVALGSH